MIFHIGKLIFGKCGLPALGVAGAAIASSIAEAIYQVIEDDPSNVYKDGGYIKRTYNTELARLKDLSEHANGYIKELEAREKEKTGIKGKLLYMPFIQTGESFTMIFKTIGALFSDSSVGVDDLSGPVGIYQQTSEVVSMGLSSLILWLGLLSLNIGVFNLFPLPILDGGRIVIVIIEKLAGKKMSEKVQNIIMMIGLVLILGIFLFATVNDIGRLLGF